MKKIFLLVIISFIFLIGCTRLNHDNYKEGLIQLEKNYYAKGEFIKSNADDVINLLNKEKSFVLFTYNNFCSMPISCEDIFKEYMKLKKVRFISLPFADFKKTKLSETVKYAPSIIIIEKGKIVTYLDANSNDDLNRYQDIKEFTNWFEQYVKV